MQIWQFCDYGPEYARNSRQFSRWLTVYYDSDKVTHMNIVNKHTNGNVIHTFRDRCYVQTSELKMWRIGCIKQIFWANQNLRPSNMWNGVEKHKEQKDIVCVHGTEFTTAPKLRMQGFQISSYNDQKKKKKK